MADETFSPPAAAAPIIGWLVSEARQLPRGHLVLQGLCERLNNAGVPIARATVHVRTLHPQVYGVAFFWRRQGSDIRVNQSQHGVRDTDSYRLSPMRLLFEEKAPEVRQSLKLPEDELPFPLYIELKQEGLTEYLALPIVFDGVIHGTTWSTDREGGFHEDEIELIKVVVSVFSLLVEVHLGRRIANNLLDAYVGHRAGERILKGQIVRGEGETIPAAIWFSDLRGFTAMSEALAREALLDRLNQYFDAIAAPINDCGGEILKFIGDAVLAIFPLSDDKACERALDAARLAKTAMGALNEKRRAAGDEPLVCGVALHVGEVMYGNIGSASRLDFTVIGPAVNLASRIEDLSKTLGAGILLSDDFAACLPPETPVRPLGRHVLKGIAREVEVFAPEPAA